MKPRRRTLDAPFQYEGRPPGVGVRTGVDKQPHDLRAVGEVARPVGDRMQGRTRLVPAAQRC